MSEQFSNLPVEQFLSPVFTGAKWNQVGKLPPKKKKHPKKGGTPTPTPPGHGHHHGGPTPNPSVTVGTPTATPTPTVPVIGTATPTVSSTATGLPAQGGAAAATASGVQASLALGGVLSVLPGSLLWTRVSRRRRRRRRPGAVG
jgi:hypothetical protein